LLTATTLILDFGHDVEPWKGACVTTAVHETALTSGEASRRLEISQVSLARLAREGRIPFSVTPHGYRVFNESDVEKLRAQRIKRGA
jgi:hypothetical protein